MESAERRAGGRPLSDFYFIRSNYLTGNLRGSEAPEG